MTHSILAHTHSHLLIGDPCTHNRIALSVAYHIYIKMSRKHSYSSYLFDDSARIVCRDSLSIFILVQVNRSYYFPFALSLSLSLLLFFLRLNRRSLSVKDFHIFRKLEDFKWKKYCARTKSPVMIPRQFFIDSVTVECSLCQCTYFSWLCRWYRINFNINAHKHIKQTNSKLFIDQIRQMTWFQIWTFFDYFVRKAIQ